ncbi:MAG TPA: ribosome small subunit-dependent GTPase A [Firmicutes bacterium]|nr:ribosome small subunit-dependent GTPase A [Candidatus Fermentithermobacillaceae bacterium]
MSHTIGKVVRTGPGTYLVDSNGDLWFCHLRGRLKALAENSRDLPCVGDIVVLESIARERREVAGATVSGTAVISEVLPRRTQISRLSPPDTPGRQRVEQVLAANVDQGVIVVSLTIPPLKAGTVERYLVLCRQAGVSAVVCLNKIDEVDPVTAGILSHLIADSCTGETGNPVRSAEAGDERWLRRTREIVSRLRNRGVPVVLTSAVTGKGLDELRRLLSGKTSVFLGPSGAGKTSILNRLEPGFAGKTLPVSSATSRGRHSTTYSSLLRVGDGEVADIPGLRAIGFWDLDEEPVRSEYEDIEELALACKFRNCSHTHEPGCAVKEAVERGELEVSRYKRYVRLMREARRRPR